MFLKKCSKINTSCSNWDVYVVPCLLVYWYLADCQMADGHCVYNRERGSLAKPLIGLVRLGLVRSNDYPQSDLKTFESLLSLKSKVTLVWGCKCAPTLLDLHTLGQFACDQNTAVVLVTAARSPSGKWLIGEILIPIRKLIRLRWRKQCGVSKWNLVVINMLTVGIKCRLLN